MDCTVNDDHDRPVIAVEEGRRHVQFADITGTITVRNPEGVRTALVENRDELSLVVRPADQ